MAFSLFWLGFLLFLYREKLIAKGHYTKINTLAPLPKKNGQVGSFTSFIL